MNDSLNKSLELTKQQRKGIVLFLVPLGLFLIILSQALFSFLYHTQLTNPGWLEIVDNLSGIGVIVVTLLYCRLFEKRRPSSLGFTTTNSLKGYLTGLILGLVLVSSAYLINIFTHSITMTFQFSQIKWWFIFFSFFGYICQGLMEETVCRGFIMNSIASRYGIWPGIIVNSLIFSSLHHANAGFTLLAAINVFLIGIFFSLLFYYTDNIFFVGAVHTAWNFTSGPLLGIKVSGLPIYSSILQTTESDTYQLVNGGTFGLEGGLAVTFPILIAIAFVLYQLQHPNKKRS
ncbi:MAG: lysostaphin resistance A-like protein [Enterococcus sp.]